MTTLIEKVLLTPTGQFFLSTGKTLYRLLEELGEFTLFGIATLRRVRGAEHTAILRQVLSVTQRSLVTVAFAGIFVGAILVLQFATILQQYDALTFLGGLNTSAVVRQVGPLIISFLLAGKVGAYTAAELGTMRVTDQIDAVQCLGVDPLQYLVVPRFLGIVTASLILLIFGLFVSVAGSLGISYLFLGINPLQFLASIPRFTALSTLAGAVIQSIVYGMIVAGVSCSKGYHATGGARGVGQAVTQAAIYTNLYIVMANYVLTTLIEWFFGTVGGG